MRGLKAKTMRRVARAMDIPDRVYGVRTRKVQVENPNYKPTITTTIGEVQKGVEPQFLTIERYQLVLGRCRRLAVQTMKKVCPKGSFFGMPVRVYRGQGKSQLPPGATIRAFDTEAEARAAAAGA